MILIGFLFVYSYLISDGVVCWNSTARYMSIDERHTPNRQSKLVTFNTLEDEIVLELNFAVPFVKIPVKKSVDATKTAMVNVNLGALVLGAATTFGGAVLVPGLLSLLNTKMVVPHPFFQTNSYSPYRRTVSSDMWRYLAILDNALMNINIDTTSCMQRTLCSTVKNSSRNVGGGKGSSMDKIIDGLASNAWLQKFLADTPFYSAMMHGLEDLDCGREYDKCTLSKDTLNMIIKKIVKRINGDA